MHSYRKGGMCVPYTVQDTTDKGRGLFADARIPEGTTVWRHVAGHYSVYDEQSLKALLSGMDDEEAVYVLHHIHCMPEFPDYMVLVHDDGSLVNHGEQPTLVARVLPGYDQALGASSPQNLSELLLGGHFTLVAARDIEKGKELTLDYNEDPDGPDYYDALCKRYGITWDWF